MTTEEKKEAIINEFLQLKGFQRQLIKQLLKKTHELTYTIDYSRKEIGFKMVRETGKVILDKKYLITEKYANVIKENEGSADVYYFNRADVELILNRF